MQKPITRTCKAPNCRTKFKPKGSTQVCCDYLCAIEYMKWLKEKKDKKLLLDIYRKNKILKDKAKTLSAHKKELQVLVNKFVQIRDKGIKCVSCDTPDIGIKRDASHFWSQGGNPSVRFDLDNIHSSCVHCNRDLHGNLLEYRPRLIKRIGQKRFDALEVRRTQSNKQTIDDILKLKELFKWKIKFFNKSEECLKLLRNLKQP